MIAARVPEQRAAGAKLLTVDRLGRLRHRLRRDVIEVLRTGDLVIANDAATLPASLSGRHLPSGRRIEVRLAGRESLDVTSVNARTAVPDQKPGKRELLRVGSAVPLALTPGGATFANLTAKAGADAEVTVMERAGQSARVPDFAPFQTIQHLLHRDEDALVVGLMVAPDGEGNR